MVIDSVVKIFLWEQQEDDDAHERSSFEGGGTKARTTLHAAAAAAAAAVCHRLIKKHHRHLHRVSSAYLTSEGDCEAQKKKMSRRHISLLKIIAGRAWIVQALCDRFARKTYGHMSHTAFFLSSIKKRYAMNPSPVLTQFLYTRDPGLLVRRNTKEGQKGQKFYQGKNLPLSLERALSN